MVRHWEWGGQRRGRHSLTRWLLALLALLAAGQLAAAAESGCPVSRSAELLTLRDQRLAFYNRTFPDIQFVAVGVSGDGTQTLNQVIALLGEDPRALDYEHPADLAIPLLQVSLHRIALLTEYQIPSASLFQVGRAAEATRPKLCVITLAPCAIASNDQQATSFMLQLPSNWVARVPPRYRLDADAYLDFSIDHEAFHCLDANDHGGMPLGHADYWGEYWRTRNEMGADAFAVAMAIWRGDDAGFLTNLARLRGLALYDGDPQHFTYQAIKAVSAENLDDLRAMTPQQLAGLAHHTAEAQLPDYQAFERFWGSAHAAMDTLGISPEDDGNRAPDADAPLAGDATQAQEMVELSRQLHAELASPSGVTE